MAAALQQAEALVALAAAAPPPGPPPGPGSPRLASDAAIASLAGSRLPTYHFAPDAASPPRVPGAPAAANDEDGGGGGGAFGWDAVKAGGQLLRGPQDPAAPGRALLDGLLQVGVACLLVCMCACLYVWLCA